MIHTEVAIIGGGPAGLSCGVYLAEWGHEVVLFDPRVPFEKPCGGGLTARIWADLPVDRGSFRSRRRVDRVHLQWGRQEVRVDLPTPLDIVSRRELGELLLQRFQAAGGAFLPRRVHQVQATTGPGWALVDSDRQTWWARYVIFADGVYGISRTVLGHFRSPGNWTRAVGYLLPGTADQVRIRFWPRMDGYAWVFPRADTLSVGLCENLTGGRKHLFKQLETWLADQGIGTDGYLDRYGYLIPAPRGEPDFAQWGPDWVRIGDAAGGADPITREGIWPAVRSAVIAAQAVHRREFPGLYAAWYRRERATELRAAARWRRWFYRPGFLALMFRMVRRPAYARLLGGLLAGQIRYTELLQYLALPGRARLACEKTV